MMLARRDAGGWAYAMTFYDREMLYDSSLSRRCVSAKSAAGNAWLTGLDIMLKRQYEP